MASVAGKAKQSAMRTLSQGGAAVAAAHLYTAVAWHGVHLSSKGGGAVAAWSSAKKIAVVFAAVAYYAMGVGNLIGAAFGIYWIRQRGKFHSEMKGELSKAANTAEKAAGIWKVFTAYMAIDGKTIERKIEEFEKKELSDQIEDVLKDYRRELGGWGDGLKKAIYGVKSKVYGIFGKSLREKNLVLERHNKLKTDMAVLAQKLYLAPTQEMRQNILKEAKRQRLIDKAERTQLKALENIVSVDFAHELFMQRDSIDIHKDSHQVHLVRLYNRVERNYEKNRALNIAQVVSQIVVGASSIILAATVTGLILNVVVGALGAFSYAKSAYDMSFVVRYLCGADVPTTFAEDITNIFARFNHNKVVPLQLKAKAA